MADDLILARVRILKRKGKDIEIARQKISAFRAKVTKKQNEKNIYRLRKTPLKVRDLVLKFDIPRSNDISIKIKIARKWYSLFRIFKYYNRANHYKLEILNSYEITKSIYGDHLKKFVKDENS